MKRRKTKFVSAFIGNRGPQVQVQITPLQWGIGGCIGRERIGLRLGPVAAVLWFRLANWEKGLDY